MHKSEKKFSTKVREGKKREKILSKNIYLFFIVEKKIFYRREERQ